MIEVVIDLSKTMVSGHYRTEANGQSEYVEPYMDSRYHPMKMPPQPDFPAGAPTAGIPPQQPQQSAGDDQFKEWFGNSQVLTPQGAPAPVFTVPGTTDTYTTSPQSAHADDQDPQGQEAASPQQLFLRVSNPMNADARINPDTLASLTDTDPPLAAAMGSMAQARTGVGQSDWQRVATGHDLLNGLKSLGRDADLPGVLQRAGYDGMTHAVPGPPTGDRHWIVTSPEQVADPATMSHPEEPQNEPQSQEMAPEQIGKALYYSGDNNTMYVPQKDLRLFNSVHPTGGMFGAGQNVPAGHFTNWLNKIWKKEDHKATTDEQREQLAKIREGIFAAKKSGQTSMSLVSMEPHFLGGSNVNGVWTKRDLEGGTVALEGMNKTAIHEGIHDRQRHLAHGMAVFPEHENYITKHKTFKPIRDFLNASKYPKDAQSRIGEATARIGSGDWDSMGISQDQAKKWFDQYASGLVQKHGVERAHWLFSPGHEMVHQSIDEANAAGGEFPENRTKSVDTVAISEEIMEKAVGGHTSAIVALWLDMGDALKIAMPGGEPRGELHITLTFLGKASDLDDKKDALCTVLETFGRNNAPVKGTISGVGTFYGEDGKNAYYASYDSPVLNSFRERLLAAIQAIGIEVSTVHGFTPHCTLAYVDKDAEAPTYTPPKRAVNFKAITLAWGGKRTEFALTGKHSQIGVVIGKAGFFPGCISVGILMKNVAAPVYDPQILAENVANHPNSKIIEPHTMGDRGSYYLLPDGRYVGSRASKADHMRISTRAFPRMVPDMQEIFEQTTGAIPVHHYGEDFHMEVNRPPTRQQYQSLQSLQAARPDALMTYGDAGRGVYANGVGNNLKDMKADYRAVNKAMGDALSKGYEPQEAQAPPFYSNLRNVIAQKMPVMAPAAHVEGIVKSSGINPEELHYSGLQQALQKVGPKAKRDDLLATVDKNLPKLSETMLSGDGKVKAQQDAAFHAHTQASGNLQEALMHTDRDNDTIKRQLLAGELEPHRINEGVTPMTLEEYKARDPEDTYRNIGESYHDFMTGAHAAYLKEHESLPGKAQQFVDTHKRKQELEGVETSGPTQYSGYATPGGENYRELLMKLPTEPREPLNHKFHSAEDVDQSDWEVKPTDFGTFDVWHNGRIIESGNNEEEARANATRRTIQGLDSAAYNEAREKRGPEPPTYQSVHWGEPNILAHLRMDDRQDAEGRQALHLHEVQSDWHQAGRDYGYQNDPKLNAALEEAKAKARETEGPYHEARDRWESEGKPLRAQQRQFETDWELAHPEVHQVLDRDGNVIYSSQDRGDVRREIMNNRDAHDKRTVSEPYPQEWKDLSGRVQSIFNDMNSTKEAHTANINALIAAEREFAKSSKQGMPDAPFKKNWHELALKRALHEAVTGGADRLTWNTGEQQNDRFDLAHHIDQLDYEHKPDQDEWALYGKKNGRNVFDEDGMDEDRLRELVGHELAERIIAHKDQHGTPRYKHEDSDYDGGYEYPDSEIRENHSDDPDDEEEPTPRRDDWGTDYDPETEQYFVHGKDGNPVSWHDDPAEAHDQALKNHEEELDNWRFKTQRYHLMFDGEHEGTYSSEADAIRAQEDAEERHRDYYEDNRDPEVSSISGTLKGDDLSFGGEGMKGFYGSINPDTGEQKHGIVGNFLNNYTKKWGGKVGKTRISSKPVDEHERKELEDEEEPDRESNYKIEPDDKDNPDGSWELRNTHTNEWLSDHPSAEHANRRLQEILQQDKERQEARKNGGFDTLVHSLDITPAMRQEILQDGQPLWGNRNALKKALGDTEGNDIPDCRVPAIMDYLPLIAPNIIVAIGLEKGGIDRKIYGGGTSQYQQAMSAFRGGVKREQFEDQQAVAAEPAENLYNNKSDYPNIHPNCFPAGQVFAGPKVTGSTSRWYEGEIVNIETVSGNRLAVTPNHPILTPQGWIAAGLLNEGSYVVGCSSSEATSLFSDPDNNNVPSLIEDVAEAFQRSVGMATVAVPVSTEHFHGDGIGSEVCVVSTNSLLRDGFDASLSQPLPEQDFCWRCGRRHVLPGDSPGDQGFESILGATPGNLGSDGTLASAVRRFLSASSIGSLGLSANNSTIGDQHRSDDIPGAALLGSKLLDRLSSIVFADKILRVSKQDFSGHVYNLSTIDGYYTVDGIIAHNCKCYISTHGDGRREWILSNDACKECRRLATYFNAEQNIIGAREENQAPEMPKPPIQASRFATPQMDYDPQYRQKQSRRKMQSASRKRNRKGVDGDIQGVGVCILIKSADYQADYQNDLPQPNVENTPAAPAKLPGRGENVPELAELARGYKDHYGIDQPDFGPVEKLKISRSKAIGQAYQDMPHAPDDPDVARAYGKLNDETLQQYHWLTDHGYKFTPYLEGVEPYPNSKAVLDDLRANKHMYFYPTEIGFGSGDDKPLNNPLERQSGITNHTGYPMMYNDLFRCVHDAFGHGVHGVEFGPLGEEGAWRSHGSMFTPLARSAMTTETRGQNSWVNFGPHILRPDGSVPKKGEEGYIPVQDRPYADQKTGLLPEQYWEPDPNEKALGHVVVGILLKSAEYVMRDKPHPWFDRVNGNRVMLNRDGISAMGRAGINWKFTGGRYTPPEAFEQMVDKLRQAHGDSADLHSAEKILRSAASYGSGGINFINTAFSHDPGRIKKLARHEGTHEAIRDAAGGQYNEQQHAFIGDPEFTNHPAYAKAFGELGEYRQNYPGQTHRVINESLARLAAGQYDKLGLDPHEGHDFLRHIMSTGLKLHGDKFYDVMKNAAIPERHMAMAVPNPGTTEPVKAVVGIVVKSADYVERSEALNHPWFRRATGNRLWVSQQGVDAINEAGVKNWVGLHVTPKALDELKWKLGAYHSPFEEPMKSAIEIMHRAADRGTTGGINLIHAGDGIPNSIGDRKGVARHEGTHEAMREVAGGDSNGHMARLLSNDAFRDHPAYAKAKANIESKGYSGPHAFQVDEIVARLAAGQHHMLGLHPHEGHDLLNHIVKTGVQIHGDRFYGVLRNAAISERKAGMNPGGETDE